MKTPSNAHTKSLKNIRAQLLANSLRVKSLNKSSNQEGFALVMALVLGLMMTSMAVASVFVAQSDRMNAVQRKTTGSGLFIAEGGAAGLLAQFQKRNNSLLLVRNYDAINPKTNTTYLGPDGVPNSGDEETTAVDEWAGYNPSAQPCFQTMGVGAPNIQMSGQIGAGGSYTLKAYRYDPAKKVGTLFVQGSDQGQASYLTLKISVKPDLEEFPGILTTNAMGRPALRGRQVLGSTANVYYPPATSADTSLTGSSSPGDANRASYLNAIWSGPSDIGSSGSCNGQCQGQYEDNETSSIRASGDPVEGKIFACKLNPTLSTVPQGIDLKEIKDDKENLLNGVAGGIRYYQADSIKLKDGKNSLTVDTTNGPVYLYVKGPVNLSGDAQILNYRSDGKPPRVGDLRIVVVGDNPVQLRDTSCIQGAFLYNPIDDLDLFTSGKGCPGGRNTNFEGVVWMEGIYSSKNSSTNRDIPNYTLIHNQTIVPNANSGIAVPSDLSSLIDLIPSIDWPVRYRVEKIDAWQRVRL